MFKMVGICWRVQVYIVRQQWQKLGNSPITRPRNITDDVSCQAIRRFCLIPNNVNAYCTDERIEDIESYFEADMPAPMSFKQEVRDDCGRGIGQVPVTRTHCQHRSKLHWKT